MRQNLSDALVFARIPFEQNVFIVLAEPGVEERDKERPEDGMGGGGVEEVQGRDLGPVLMAAVGRLPLGHRLVVQVH